MLNSNTDSAAEGLKDLLPYLKNLVRFGTVSSVDIPTMTARVIFPDKNNLISGPLRLFNNRPLITIEKWVEENSIDQKWSNNATYLSANRNLGIGEAYIKGDLSDIRIHDGGEYKTYTGGKSDKIINEHASKKEIVTVYPWIPYIGQFVMCLYAPNGESDGVILGGF
ncbi:hypothetical protein FACS18949_02830 [Clostridia bacterium]|nr:hypothetical protein FACS18949_02830 [Clostridia bacterium]